MIYILTGDDLKNKNIYIKKLANGIDPIFLSANNLSKELINNYADNVSLFGDLQIVVIEDLINQNQIPFSKEDLKNLKNSDTIFILLEDKLLVADEKKYKKYSTIEKFDQKKVKQTPANNIFDIADAFARKDKIKTWTLYCQAVERGAEPESISGMLFWKIKTMILNGSRVFPLGVLKRQSSKIVSLHHKAHFGEVDFIIGLEQFILKSLS